MQSDVSLSLSLALCVKDPFSPLSITCPLAPPPLAHHWMGPLWGLPGIPREFLQVRVRKQSHTQITAAASAIYKMKTQNAPKALGGFQCWADLALKDLLQLQGVWSQQQTEVGGKDLSNQVRDHTHTHTRAQKSACSLEPVATHTMRYILQIRGSISS